MDFTSWRTDPFRSTLLRAGEGQKKLLYHWRSNHGPSGQKRSSLAFSLFTLLLFQRVKLKLLWRFFCVFLQATTDSLDTWAAADIETQYTAGSRGQDCGFCRCAGITQTFLLHEKYTWIDFILLFFFPLLHRCRKDHHIGSLRWAAAWSPLSVCGLQQFGGSGGAALLSHKRIMQDRPPAGLWGRWKDVRICWDWNILADLHFFHFFFLNVQHRLCVIITDYIMKLTCCKYFSCVPVTDTLHIESWLPAWNHTPSARFYLKAVAASAIPT